MILMINKKSMPTTIHLFLVPRGVLGVVGEHEVDGGGDDGRHQRWRDESPHYLPVRTRSHT